MAITAVTEIAPPVATISGRSEKAKALLRLGRAMPELSVLFLAACMFLGAALYTSVGHAGASAYIALMALFGIAPAIMRPTALAWNVLVASFTSFRYLRAGMFRWRTVWPFLLGAMAPSIPSEAGRGSALLYLALFSKSRCCRITSNSFKSSNSLIRQDGTTTFILLGMSRLSPSRIVPLTSIVFCPVASSSTPSDWGRGARLTLTYLSLLSECGGARSDSVDCRSAPASRIGAAG